MMPNNNLWNEVLKLVEEQSNCTKEDHPPVGAYIFRNNEEIASGKHDNDENQLYCDHAEINVLQEFFAKNGANKTEINECDFYTSLEPCNLRDPFKAPCAPVIGVLNFNAVHIGMMDPNPNVFGRGVAYLIKNFDKRNIYYAPSEIRKKIRENQKMKSYINKLVKSFDFQKFKEDNLPIYTAIGVDIESYLRAAHALSRMFDGEEIFWLFPKLPSFLDKHLFQAWWAQGALQNNPKCRVKMVLHQKEWDETITQVNANEEMKAILLDEFGKTNVDVKLSLVPDCNDKDNCPHKQFRGALLRKGGDINCIIILIYFDLLGPNGSNQSLHTWGGSMFIACELKHIPPLVNVECDKKTVTEIENKLTGWYKQYKHGDFRSLRDQLDQDLNRK